MSFLEHQGRTLCYRLLGDPAKPLMLLAHPLGMNQTVWDEMLPALLGHFRTLTWDLPGHGSSSAWPEQAVTAADLAAEALTLAAVAGAERFHFVGTSIGGIIGQQLLCQAPERLDSVTLTNTGAVIGTPEAWQLRPAMSEPGGWPPWRTKSCHGGLAPPPGSSNRPCWPAGR